MQHGAALRGGRTDVRTLAFGESGVIAVVSPKFARANSCPSNAGLKKESPNSAKNMAENYAHAGNDTVKCVVCGRPKKS